MLIMNQSLSIFIIINASLCIIAMVFALAFITLFFPKRLLNNYFKEPYFSKNELIIYNSFPFKTFRTFLFMILILKPDFAKKNPFVNIRKFTPLWFFILSTLTVPIFTLLSITAIFFLLFGGFLPTN